MERVADMEFTKEERKVLGEIIGKNEKKETGDV